MKDCLVSFSSGQYNEPLLDMLDSAVEHWKGDYLIYSPDHRLEDYRGITIHKGWPVGSYTHQQIPYQFKIALINQARQMGYERVIWLDTSIKFNKDITSLFGPTGVGLFHNLGHPLYMYISDEAVRLLGVTDLNIPQIWGGVLLFDFTKINARTLFKAIDKASVNGSFNNSGSTRPRFIAHRHDQAVISVLAYNRCDLYPYGKIASVKHAKTGEFGNDIYLIYGK